ncbi:MAG: hypothetical protein ACSLFF_04685 [Solirubrobacterales bacterium]
MKGPKTPVIAHRAQVFFLILGASAALILSGCSIGPMFGVKEVVRVPNSQCEKARELFEYEYVVMCRPGESDEEWITFFFKRCAAGAGGEIAVLNKRDELVRQENCTPSDQKWAMKYVDSTVAEEDLPVVIRRMAGDQKN